MLSERVLGILEGELIAFMTAIDESGQPQTAPIWFVMEDEDIIVYNKSGTPRLTSIASNPKISFNLRGDRRGRGAVIIEGSAAKEESIPPAKDFPGYVDKYGRDIELLGWTPETFSVDYDTPVRIVVTRVRAWGLEALE